jgi:hypothetical protein
MSFTQYRRRTGDPIRAQDWNAVLAELDRRLGFPSSGRARRVRSASSAGDVAFEASLSQVGDHWEATFARGLIAGYEPVIGKLKISDIDPATKTFPVLRIDPAKDIDAKTGTGYVYARLSLTNDWGILKIEPVCLPAPPDAPARKWKAYKLLALLVRTPPGDTGATLDVWQAVEHNLGWAAIQRRTSGDARHLFWATS